MPKEKIPNIFVQYLVYIIKTDRRIRGCALYYPRIKGMREKQKTPNIYLKHLEHIILTGTRFGNSVLYAPKISGE